ncbi:multicopper oxidase family protein [Cellulosilyticum sp. I15G10I2]|uniref:multicopper oxidase family protein n=1 Tax=Cellulosilyticum sp. I15G10I2 TaxID=1892843 RepID=UPI00085C3B48|nr:multicopper oxidase family protein [Cellulosilyticum sp. I15G10I2]
MSNQKIMILTFIAMIVVAFATMVAYKNKQRMSAQEVSAVQEQIASSESMDMEQPKQNADNILDNAENIIQPKDGQPIKRFTLNAMEANLQVKDNLNIMTWTYNGTVPGQEIRVKQGDFVEVELRNNLKEPVTIHWHGYPLKSSMDGVPGLNQDAVRPGETFTYAFSADVAGTYWYHSHQESSKQVDKGLYGVLVVEPENWVKPDRDYTLILDEWMENPEEGMDAMNGMKMSSETTKDLVMEEEEMMSSMYNIYTVNGKSSSLITPLEVKKGELVRLRFLNAGYREHGIHIPNQEIKIVSTDGQDITNAGIIKDKIIMIAPGERYDIEFVVKTDENFVIDTHDDNKYSDQIKIPVNIIDGNGRYLEELNNAEFQIFDFASYGSGGNARFTLEETYDIDYRVDLNTDTSNDELKYTINGKVFMELPPLKIKTNDTIKMTYVNNSKVDHPMHLHGHFFQVLSKNGAPLTGAVIMKDTLMIKPGEEYVVAFEADNPGDWVQHCHELHHAAAGMMQRIEYADFTSNYTPDPSATFNKPE